MSNEHDTFPVWKLSAQQQIDDYREEVKILKSENARLKQELEAVSTAAYLYGRTDLADENAKLREKVQRQADELTALRKAIEQRNSELRPWKRQAERFAAENAKLRKLVKQMHDHIKESCDICDEDYCSSWDEDNECCIYDTLAREVGIEVGK